MIRIIDNTDILTDNNVGNPSGCNE